MLPQIIRKLSHRAPVTLLRFLGNIWPPYLFSGVKIETVNPDFRYLKVILRFGWYNRNYVGTQFGGSIYSMTDPFYMMMIMNNLGPKYIVWDKASKIDFLKPGRTKLSAEFTIDDTLLNEIKSKTQSGEKYIFDLPVDVKDTQGVVIANIVKTIYVKLK